MRIATALLALSTLALAEGEHIRDLNLGEYWYGAQIDMNDLKGKVVLVEIWGS